MSSKEKKYASGSNPIRSKTVRCTSIVPIDFEHDLQRASKAILALFATEYATAQLLLSWGITPSAMIGHSLGEYTAACIAGVLTLEECLTLVALRGRIRSLVLEARPQVERQPTREGP